MKNCSCGAGAYYVHRLLDMLAEDRIPKQHTVAALCKFKCDVPTDLFSPGSMAHHHAVPCQMDSAGTTNDGPKWAIQSPLWKDTNV